MSSRYFTKNLIRMFENRFILQESSVGDRNAAELIHTDDITGKDPLILCALVVVGLIGFLYVLHCLNRNDFSPKYIQKNSFELSHSYETPSSTDHTNTKLVSEIK